MTTWSDLRDRVDIDGIARAKFDACGYSAAVTVASGIEAVLRPVVERVPPTTTTVLSKAVGWLLFQKAGAYHVVSAPTELKYKRLLRNHGLAGLRWDSGEARRLRLDWSLGTSIQDEPAGESTMNEDTAKVREPLRDAPDDLAGCALEDVDVQFGS